MPVRQTGYADESDVLTALTLASFRLCLKGMKKYFNQYDANGDGFITMEELRAFLTSVGKKVSEEEVREGIREADIDGDGKVDWKEFVDSWTRGLIEGVNFEES